MKKGTNLFNGLDDGVFDDFPKISEDFPKFFPKARRNVPEDFPENFRRFPKIAEDFRLFDDTPTNLSAI